EDRHVAAAMQRGEPGGSLPGDRHGFAQNTGALQREELSQAVPADAEHLMPDRAFDFVDRRILLGRVADEGLQFVQEFGEVFALEDVLLVCDAPGGLLGVMGTRRQLRGDNMAVAKECLAPGGPFAYPSNNTTIIQNTTSARADDRLRPVQLTISRCDRQGWPGL